MCLYNSESLIEKCGQLDLKISDKQLSQFIKYYELLAEWNSFMNLTAITEYEEVVLKHFVDSLALYKAEAFKKAYAEYINRKELDKYPDEQKLYLIDIGTGAGFPGIPLKIMFPEIKVTLLDSLQKRLHFLDAVIEKLELTDMDTIHGRAEDYGRQPDYRERYDFCVSRAVANLATLSELSIPFVKKDGYFISYKSEKADEELAAGRKAISLLGGTVENQIKYILPDTDINRSLLLIKKIKKTPEKYPRKAGTPGKSPLI